MPVDYRPDLASHLAGDVLSDDQLPQLIGKEV